LKLKIGTIMIILSTYYVSETFNKYLKKLFAKKPTFFNYYQNFKKKNQNITLFTKGELLKF